MEIDKTRQEMLDTLIIEAVRKAHVQGFLRLTFALPDEAYAFLEGFRRLVKYIAMTESEGLAKLRKIFAETACRIEEREKGEMHCKLSVFRLDCDPWLTSLAAQLGEKLPKLGEGS